jgi:hypothetical protein
MEMEPSSTSGAKDTNPSNDVVLTKYNMAAEICNVVLKVFFNSFAFNNLIILQLFLKELISQSKDGADVCELCANGDKRLLELTGNLFKKEKNVKKGIGKISQTLKIIE